jgi:hypothetical protein
MLYEYLCSTCGKTIEAVRTVANRNRAPRHCGKATKRQFTPSVHIVPNFQPYRVVGEERGLVINSRQEHRDYLRRHGYAEVGNDPSFAPPPHDPDRIAEKQRETKEALEQLKYAPSIDGTA